MTGAELLVGSYDLHVHCSPDSVPRAQSCFELAEAASKAGMTGVGLKDHGSSTVGRCAVLNEIHDGNPRFISSIVLNPSVGGLNPCAVEAALGSGCEIIYFPTYGARHQIESEGRTGMPYSLPSSFEGIGLGDTSAVGEILELIAKHGAVLATGHLSARESVELLEQARAVGVTKMIVTHASEPVPKMSIEDQRRCVAAGSLIEHCFMACTQCSAAPIPLEEIASQIRQIGVDHVVLSSDLGQVANGAPVEGFANHLDQMLGLGFSEKELATMIRTNPERLVGAVSPTG